MSDATEIRVDFHTHSCHSDGVLTPKDLVARAAARGVSTLALTDHDTTAGLAEAATACAAHGIRFVRGIEVSGSYRGQAIHVIGLGLPDTAPELDAHVASIVVRRRERIAAIGERLTKRSRLPGADLAAAVLGSATSPTRLHMARALVAAGHASELQDAFDRWLNRDRPGHVPIEWPDLSATLGALRSSGAQIVLAHPHRYRLSNGALRDLAVRFKEEGGVALEQSIAGMSPNDMDRIARLCRAFDLDASLGSDFHDPEVPWNPLGRWLKLADGLRPIMARL
jgi:predicted metal-dependent phosphoesterase TrpH